MNRLTSSELEELRELNNVFNCIGHTSYSKHSKILASTAVLGEDNQATCCNKVHKKLDKVALLILDRIENILTDGK